LDCGGGATAFFGIQVPLIPARRFRLESANPLATRHLQFLILPSALIRHFYARRSFVREPLAFRL
jgi:hypothetical protein